MAGRFFCVRCSRHFSWALYCGLGCFAVYGLFFALPRGKGVAKHRLGRGSAFSFSKKSVFKILYFGLFFFCVFFAAPCKMLFLWRGSEKTIFEN